jgi:hypothetical protein
MYIIKTITSLNKQTMYIKITIVNIYKHNVVINEITKENKIYIEFYVIVNHKYYSRIFTLYYLVYPSMILLTLLLDLINFINFLL